MIPTVRVIGCGNELAGDDAVGLLAVRLARPRLSPEVEVVEAGLSLRVLDLLDGVDAVVIVDAVRTTRGARPAGTLIRAAGSDGLSTELRGSLSSHAFGLAEAVGLSAVMAPLPHVVFVGVEAADLAAGAPLSPAVHAALPALVEAVVSECAALAGTAA